MKVLTNPDPKLIELMQREALVLQLQQHPGLPKTTVDDYFTFTPPGGWELHCLVMQKFQGQNLEQQIAASGRISQATALNWLSQLVDILDSVHRSGFFHRDIKPSNIILQPSGQLALIDFGAVREVTNTYLAKVSSNGGTETGIGAREITAIRTARYSPLEQINGQAVPQSDFYALGRTFVYLITGIPLIDLPTNQETGRLIWRNKASHIDQPCADLLDDLMAPFPGQRPQSTQVILQRLERLPLQSKLNRIFKSNPFKVGMVGLGLLAGWGIYQTSLPIAANYFLNRGTKAQLENHPSEAQQNFQLAIKLHPQITNTISNFYFQQASRALNRPQSARNYYELAIKYNPNDVDAYHNLAVVCQQLNDVKCVINNYQTTFKLEPNNWEGHYSLGSFYDEQGNYELATQQYQISHQKGGDLAVDAVNNLARLANRKGQYNEAIKLARQGLNLNPNLEVKASLSKNLSWALLEQKMYSEAQNYLQKSLSLDPQRVDTYCLLAQVQEALGNVSDAKGSWEVCLLGDSNLPEVMEWKQQVLERVLKSK
ncbi:protein kinase [Merismopedia glauca CCAP 1448/3]|uniref:non-specific serine/threonine protein kinase n=2 Tax=Merismopedia TaxID=53402 RepID=A0A2T1C9Q8_9CYAN|nr:protein kinase [Merismopedia glauca CCAP 1448/3]